MRDGEVDIVIGTHRLTSGDVQFKDLGLVILDEEQRFGVRHKEKLKKLKTNVDVLTLSATSDNPALTHRARSVGSGSPDPLFSVRGWDACHSPKPSASLPISYKALTSSAESSLCVKNGPSDPPAISPLNGLELRLLWTAIEVVPPRSSMAT